MELRGVLVHPELLQAAVTHLLVQDLHLLHPGHARQVLLQGGSELELQTKVRKDFIITEKASTKAFSLLKVPTNTLTLKNLLRHYAK